MQILSPRIDWFGFLERIAGASERVLMLDYDGTLAPFHVQPERATPYPGVREALDALVAEGHTRVVIVSGRTAAEVVPLLALTHQPEIWGCHGWERLLPDGKRHAQEPSAEIKLSLERAADAVGDALASGARLERKQASLALHWRGLPPHVVAKVEALARAAWTPLSRDGRLQLLPFDGGIELRAQACNKQHAVKAVLSQTTGGSVIAYLGDDITDEDAFVAVKSRGIAVLVRPELRETQADVWLQPPHELIEFLDRWRKGSPGRH